MPVLGGGWAGGGTAEIASREDVPEDSLLESYVNTDSKYVWKRGDSCVCRDGGGRAFSMKVKLAIFKDLSKRAFCLDVFITFYDVSVALCDHSLSTTPHPVNTHAIWHRLHLSLAVLVWRIL